MSCDAPKKKKKKKKTNSFKFLFRHDWFNPSASRNYINGENLTRGQGVPYLIYTPQGVTFLPTTCCGPMEPAIRCKWWWLHAGAADSVAIALYRVAGHLVTRSEKEGSRCSCKHYHLTRQTGGAPDADVLTPEFSYRSARGSTELAPPMPLGGLECFQWPHHISGIRAFLFDQPCRATLRYFILITKDPSHIMPRDNPQLVLTLGCLLGSTTGRGEGAEPGQRILPVKGLQ